jgi:WD40 repeat protein
VAALLLILVVKVTFFGGERHEWQVAGDDQPSAIQSNEKRPAAVKGKTANKGGHYAAALPDFFERAQKKCADLEKEEGKKWDEIEERRRVECNEALESEFNQKLQELPPPPIEVGSSARAYVRDATIKPPRFGFAGIFGGYFVFPVSFTASQALDEWKHGLFCRVLGPDGAALEDCHITLNVSANAGDRVSGEFQVCSHLAELTTITVSNKPTEKPRTPDNSSANASPKHSGDDDHTTNLPPAEATTLLTRYLELSKSIPDKNERKEMAEILDTLASLGATAAPTTAALAKRYVELSESLPDEGEQREIAQILNALGRLGVHASSALAILTARYKKLSESFPDERERQEMTLVLQTTSRVAAQSSDSPKAPSAKPTSEPDRQIPSPTQRQMFMLPTERNDRNARISDDEGELISCVAFSPDGSQALTGGADGALYLWGVKSRVLVKRLDTHKGRVNAVAFLPSGKQAMSVGNDGLVHLWDLTSDQIVRLGQSPGDECLALAVSQDGTHAVTGGKDKKLSFWDLMQRKLKIAVPQNDHVLCLAMSGDKKRAVSGGRDGVVRIWDSDKGAEIGQFTEHKSSVIAVAISPDGQMAASSSETDTDLPLWDVQTKQVLRRYDTKGVKQLAFTHDGTHLLSRSKSVRLWHVDFMPPLASIGDDVSCFAVAPDDRSILVAGGYLASVVQLPSLTGRGDFPAGELASFPRGVHSPPSHSVSDDASGLLTRPKTFLIMKTVWAVSDDASRVLTGFEGGYDSEYKKVVPPQYVLWDGKSGLKIKSFEGTVGVSPGCQWIAHLVASQEESAELERDLGGERRKSKQRRNVVVRLMDTTGRNPEREIKPPDLSYGGRPSVVVSADGRFLLIGGWRDGKAWGLWWDVEHGREVERGRNDFDGVFLPDGQHMLVWSGPKWEESAEYFGTNLVTCKDGKVVHSFPVEGRKLAASRDYRYLVGMAKGERIGVWDTLNGKLLSEIECPDGYKVQSVSFDGARLAATKYVNVVVLDTKTGRIVRQLKETCGGRVCFTLDGTHILVGGNSRLEVWNVDSESRVASLERRSNLDSDEGEEEINVLPGGRLAVTVDKGALVLWKLP